MTPIAGNGAQNAPGNASKEGRHLKKWMRSQEKSQKLGVTRLKNARYAVEQAEFDLFRASLV
ncbi:MAG: hypothetical protein A3I66_21170 [Burkholderiales bacterium RIFCSPLOWO2_02_FULL_57_36]|nr:MAG: hypothetical protein A3I66_21170 [Burkholderiales bacterium RIFCSPLOWO2_02_FULL_57_36]